MLVLFPFVNLYNIYFFVMKIIIMFLHMKRMKNALREEKKEIKRK